MRTAEEASRWGGGQRVCHWTTRSLVRHKLQGECLQIVIVEVIIPGAELDLVDKNQARDLMIHIHHLCFSVARANAALNLFMNVKQTRRRPLTNEQWDAEQTEERIRFEIEDRLMRDQWRSEGGPEALLRQNELIFAEAFIHAIDSFGKHLDKLRRMEGARRKLEQKNNRFRKIFADATGVRDTIQHSEDRARWRNKFGGPLDIEETTSSSGGAIQGNSLVLAQLIGTSYAATMQDGRLGKVNISPQSLSDLGAILSEVLDSFNWSGPKRHLLRY